MNNDIKEILDNEYVIEWMPVGSQVTCNPPPPLIKNGVSDNDTLVLTKSFWFKNRFRNLLLKEDFTIDPHPYCNMVEKVMAPRSFLSMSKRTDRCRENIILTESRSFYNRFKAATHIATKLNLLEKRERICLFQGILYDNFENPHSENWWET